MFDCILNGKQIYAWMAEDREADYRCPKCNEPVRLRKGCKKIPHFAHIATKNCLYGEALTEDHLIVQKELFEIFEHNNIPCKIEYRGIDGRRADVFTIFQNSKIVFEIQHSRIEPQTILERNQDYNRADCSVMWILTPFYFAKFAGEYKTEKIRFSSWQQYLKELYGVVYVWNKGSLYAFDFDTAWTQKPIFEYGKLTGYEDIPCQESFDKIGVAKIDLMFGIQNKTLHSFNSDLAPYSKLFGLDPSDAFPADWKYPRTHLEWNDPLR